ncbi:MAG: dihydrolipoyl dehydrogenase [Actinomycetota bacterium]|nr:dihydrolipoyl dehydrogenase [Actinomycetota bacterium]MDH5223649.1 dihydrolipoyl dehydrogenase [Actinomycetota bacterium]MDH5312395.1 dihydrolipoyl dehydrogenase [Actinomycetota bacterium]
MGDTYDVAVIGGGTAGYSAALRAAQLGLRVVLVERDDRLGGTCLLRGCIPTKALLQSAAVMDTIERSDEWGIKASGEPDWSAVKAFEDSVVDKLVKGVSTLVKARKIRVVRGQARLVPGATAVDVDGARIDARDVVIATGSTPKLLPGLAITDRIITSDQALWYERLPESAVVIGAGAVGLEFASFYRSFGADVTLVEALPRLAPLEDDEVSKEIARAYRKRGITTSAGASVEQVKDTGESVEVTYDAGNGAVTVSADVCLVATGRGPVTEGLGLAEVGVSTQEKGYVNVDASLRTNVDHLWAIGDVASTPLQLAHVAFTEGYAVAERIAGLPVSEIDYVNIPKVTYCTPEIASVGLTESQAREAGVDVAVDKVDFRGIGKANMLAEGGFVKVVAEVDGPVRGVHMIGPHVTDLIAEGMLIVNWEAMPAEVAAMMHPHPSLSEGIGEAHLALAGKPLHTP